MVQEPWPLPEVHIRVFLGLCSPLTKPFAYMTSRTSHVLDSSGVVLSQFHGEKLQTVSNNLSSRVRLTTYCISSPTLASLNLSFPNCEMELVIQTS